MYFVIKKFTFIPQTMQVSHQVRCDTPYREG
jgi:hypothetical protein